MNRPSMATCLSTAPPAYLQIADSISRRIRAGELAVGERLPPERELSAELAVSRMTVRQALLTLQEQGLIECRPGVGSFVGKPRIEQPIDVLVGFFDNIAHRGYEPSSRLLSMERILAKRPVAQALHMGLGASVFHLHRLRLANGVPMALEHSYFPAQRCRGLERHNLEQCSVYAILTDECGIRLDYAEQSLQATVARPHEARLLAIPTGSPLMMLERVTYDGDGQPIEYAKDLYRGDSFRFVSRSRPPR